MNMCQEPPEKEEEKEKERDREREKDRDRERKRKREREKHDENKEIRHSRGRARAYLAVLGGRVVAQQIAVQRANHDHRHLHSIEESEGWARERARREWARGRDGDKSG